MRPGGQQIALAAARRAPQVDHAFGRAAVEHGCKLRHQLDIAPRHKAGKFGLGGRTDIEKELLHGALG